MGLLQSDYQSFVAPLEKQIAELQEKLRKSDEHCDRLAKSNEAYLKSDAEWRIMNKGNISEITRLKDKLHRRNLQIADLKKKQGELPIKAIADLIYTEGFICKRGDGHITNNEIAAQKRSLKAIGAIPYDEKFKAIYEAMDIRDKDDLNRLYNV